MENRSSSSSDTPMAQYQAATHDELPHCTQCVLSTVLSTNAFVIACADDGRPCLTAIYEDALRLLRRQFRRHSTIVENLIESELEQVNIGGQVASTRIAILSPEAVAVFDETVQETTRALERQDRVDRHIQNVEDYMQHLGSALQQNRPLPFLARATRLSLLGLGIRTLPVVDFDHIDGVVRHGEQHQQVRADDLQAVNGEGSSAPPQQHAGETRRVLRSSAQAAQHVPQAATTVATQPAVRAVPVVRRARAASGQGRGGGAGRGGPSGRSRAVVRGRGGRGGALGAGRGGSGAGMGGRGSRGGVVRRARGGRRGGVGRGGRIGRAAGVGGRGGSRGGPRGGRVGNKGRAGRARAGRKR